MSDEFYHPRPRARVTASAWSRWLVAFGVLVGASAAPAANSPTAGSDGLDELSQTEILNHLYGGAFQQSGDNFLNGTVEVKRIDDEAGAEQIFHGELVSARAVAAFSRNTQTLGVLEGSLRPLFTVTGQGFDVAGSADLNGEDLTKTIFALQSGARLLKQAGDAATGPLRTYSVTGAGQDVTRDTFLMFWEDAETSDSGFDHNDLVVEVGATAGGRSANSNVMIPLPAAAWSGLTVMGGVSLMAGLRRLRQRLR